MTVEGHQLSLLGGEPEPIVASPPSFMDGGEVAIFGLFARHAAGRLVEITAPERDIVLGFAALHEGRFPFLADAARQAIGRLPDAPTQNPAVLWERGAPADSSTEAHAPVAHIDKTEAEKKALDRLLRSPGKTGTMRDKVLSELIRLSVDYPDLAMTKIELAEAMRTTRDHVHPRMEELFKGGWVKRSDTVDDKRSGVLFYPTPKAYAWYRDKDQT